MMMETFLLIFSVACTLFVMYWAWSALSIRLDRQYVRDRYEWLQVMNADRCKGRGELLAEMRKLKGTDRSLASTLSTDLIYLCDEGLVELHCLGAFRGQPIFKRVYKLSPAGGARALAGPMHLTEKPAL
jgi:hypothetical protein